MMNKTSKSHKSIKPSKSPHAKIGDTKKYPDASVPSPRIPLPKKPPKKK